MIAIITGDIVGSQKVSTDIWMPILKNCIKNLALEDNDWQIYRGDEFQLKTTSEKALLYSIIIKATIKKIKNLDVRIAIGVGFENFTSELVGQSNGTAYLRSGRAMSILKPSKTNLIIKTGDELFDRTLNLMIKLSLNFMNNWSQVSAEIVLIALDDKALSQNEIAKVIGVKQSAVSQRLNRSKFDLVLDLLNYYKDNINNVK